MPIAPRHTRITQQVGAHVRITSYFCLLVEYLVRRVKIVAIIFRVNIDIAGLLRIRIIDIDAKHHLTLGTKLNLISIIALVLARVVSAGITQQGKFHTDQINVTIAGDVLRVNERDFFRR